MADISKITLPSGTTYDIKDATARTQIAALQAGGLTYVIVDTLPTASAETLGNIYMIAKTSSENQHFYSEYMTIEKTQDNYQWEEIGDTQIDLSDYAKHGDAVETTGTAANNTTGISVSGHSVTQGDVSVTGKFTPSGSIGVGTGTANYTPGGTLSGGVIGVTPETTKKYVASSANGGGSVTNGSAASCTLPTLTTTVSDETLTLSWTAGSFEANIPTEVTLPSFTEQTIATGIQSAAITTQPTFTGTGVQLAFTGSEGDVSASGKTSGVAVAAHTITDNGHTHTVNSTGTISE